MDYVEKLIATRKRNRRIVAAVETNTRLTGKPGFGATARKFNLSRQRIEQIWKKAKQNGAKAVSSERP